MDLSFRRATAADSDLLADLVLGEPRQETTRVAMCLYGLANIEKARQLFRMLWSAAENWKLSELAIVVRDVAGVLQTGRSSTRVTVGVIVIPQHTRIR